MDIKIRKARANDWQVIRQLNKELIIEERTKGHDDELNVDWPQSMAAEKYYRKAVSSRKYLALIAEDNSSNILGYIIGCSENKFSYRRGVTGELCDMYIAEAARRKGVGRELVVRLRYWLKQKGVERIYVSAYSKNLPAIGFYQAVGFDAWSQGLEMKV